MTASASITWRRGSSAAHAAHGKVAIVDGRVALVGSLALSATSLGLRRELSLIVHEPSAVRRLEAFVAAATA